MILYFILDFDYEMLMMCYNLVKDLVKNISYNYERIYCDLESIK